MPEILTDIAGLLAGLTIAERQRVGRMVRFRDRTLHAAAHALLHLAVFQETGRRPRDFLIGPHGKPALAACGDPPLGFSLAHARGLAVCAVARGMDIGVDAERIESGLDIVGIAAMQFHPAERDRLAAMPEPDRAEAFCRLWTLREAVLKACGQGWNGGESFAVALDPPRLDLEVQAATPEFAWHVEESAVVPGYRMALAARLPSGLVPRVSWRAVALADLHASSD